MGKVYVPADIRRSPDVGLMLGRRRRRRPNIKPTSGQRVVSAGYCSQQCDRTCATQHLTFGPSIILFQIFQFGIFFVNKVVFFG